MRWCAASELRGVIATAILQGSASEADRDAVRVGDFMLRADQRRTLAELRAAVAEFGGALLADPPGTGKTVLALAFAAPFGRALVIAPAALRAQWSAMAARAAVAIDFCSVEAASRAGTLASAPCVIVDEAHHLREPATRRYSRVAAACAGRPVLLLSATPVVNRTADRDALLALFLGDRARRLGAAALGRVIVRQVAEAASDTRPHLRRLPPLRPLYPMHASQSDARSARARDQTLCPSANAELDEAIGEAIAALPPPFPVDEGSPATALVRMSLAMAWQSSLAALDRALRRRVQRGEAMADLLDAGLRPSRVALRQWTLHDDATQLAFPFSEGASPPAPAPADLRAQLDAHLNAVRALRARIGPAIRPDAEARARALLRLLEEHPGRRLVAFARHAETVRALYAELRGEWGVVAIIGTRVLAAAGRWRREEVLRALGPDAPPLGAPGAHGPRRIRLLLATDAVSEGVEMQGIGIVVHADLPWTPSRLEQRVGRVRRAEGARAPAARDVAADTPTAHDPPNGREVYETAFETSVVARRLVRLGARLSRKSRARDAAVRDGQARTAMLRQLRHWHDLARSPDEKERVDAPGCVPLVASHATTGERSAFIALVRTDRGYDLIGGVQRRDGGRNADPPRARRWRLGSHPRHLLPVLRRVSDDAVGRDTDVGPAERDMVLARRVLRLVDRALSRRAARAVLGDAYDPRVERIRRRLARLLEHAPSLARRAVAATHQRWLAILSNPMGAHAEERLDALCRRDVDDAVFARALGPLLRRFGGDRGDRGSNASAPVAVRRPRVVALLLLRPRASPPAGAPGRARSSTSPGIAASR